MHSESGAAPAEAERGIAQAAVTGSQPGSLANSLALGVKLPGGPKSRVSLAHSVTVIFILIIIPAESIQ